MATRLYLHNAAAAYTPATIRGAWDNTGSAVTKRLDGSKNGGGAISSASTSGNAPYPWDILYYRGVSAPLGAQTIAGNISGVINAYELAGDANAVFHVHIYVTQGDSDTPRGTILSDYIDATELPINGFIYSGAALASAALSSLAVSAGDRIVIELGTTHPVGSSGAHTGISFGGGDESYDASVGNLGAGTASWVEFDSTLVWGTTALRVSQTVAEAVLLSSASPALQASQVVAEVALIPSASPALQVTQTVIEVLIASTPAATNIRSQAIIVG